MTLPPSRIEQLQVEMRAASVDALFLCLAENILLATGYWLQIGNLGFVFVPEEGAATLIIPEYEAEEAKSIWAGEICTFPAIRLDKQPAGETILRHLGDLASRHGSKGGRVGFEGSFQAVAPPVLDGEPNTVASGTAATIRAAFETEELFDFTASLEDVRAVKTADEIERIRVTNEIACFGLDTFKEASVAGRTEAEVAAAVSSAIVSKGHGYRGTRVVRSYPTVWSGPETADGWQYFRHRNRVIEPNDVVMIELGTVADGFWSDHTRTVVAGSATDSQKARVRGHPGRFARCFRRCKAWCHGRSGRCSLTLSLSGRRLRAVPAPHGSWHRLPLPRVVATARSGQRSRHRSRPRHSYGARLLCRRPGGFRHEDNAVVAESGANVLATTSYGLDD